MTIKAILFGSIGAVAETSDIQRRAYNQAMREHGLQWDWSPEVYSELLETSGGKDRLALLAKATGTHLSNEDIAHIHARKTEIACREVRESGIVTFRPGVEALVRHAKDQGLKLGFVTTTYRSNVDAILSLKSDHFSEDDLDVIILREDVQAGKPSPEAYQVALSRLGVSASEAIAIEDTHNSILSAKRAGLTVIATPGALKAGQDTHEADLALSDLGDGQAVDSQVLELIGYAKVPLHDARETRLGQKPVPSMA
ncbi:MAG: HAD-IA family hydrolase [Pseudomonadota bacterium]